LDLRSASEDERWELLRSRAEALAGGEALDVEDRQDPRPLLGRIESAHPGTFEAVFRASGPGRYRLEVRRRPPDAAHLVSDTFGREHRRLVGLMEDVEHLARGGAFELAAACYKEFRCGLARHMLVEEQVLLPEFETLPGGSHDPCAATKQDHIVLRRAFDAMAETLRRHELEHFLSAMRAFVEVWGEHNLREERVLFPAIDEARDERARAELLGRAMCF